MGFKETIATAGQGTLLARGIEVLQVNMGYKCNMSCGHCHVEAGPGRPEAMDRQTAEEVLKVLGNSGIEVLDITGGAPELNPGFRYLVEEAKKAGRHVIVRSNLTAFFEEGMEYLYEFFAEKAVEITASLPCYLEDNVDLARGPGVFKKCISSLRRLNSLGYGSDTSKRLNLVFNPQGAALPPPQAGLEEDYKRELKKKYGISFDRLFAFANMPIGRFRGFLERNGLHEIYMEKLACAFNKETLEGLMCRRLISVGWDGRLYDCDFNQMLGLAVSPDCPQHIRGFDIARLSNRKVSVGDHCCGCTAGQGST